MTRVSDLPEFPPVGTRCLYLNPALNLKGWGVIAAPRDADDGDDLPYQEGNVREFIARENNRPILGPPL